MSKTILIDASGSMSFNGEDILEIMQLLPAVTILGMQLGTLLAGAVITETIFSWPGIGQLMIESIQKRDYPVIQGCVILISFTYVLVNLVTDFICLSLDPRIKLDS